MNFKISAKFLFSFFVFLIFITAGCTPDPGLRWNEQDGYRWAELPGRFFDNTGFRLIEGTDSGISFANQVEDETIRENRHYANGSGVAIGDVTGDGLPDIYFASLEGSNKLYENLGNLQFRDITDEAGVAHSETSSTGVLMLDVNGNGHNDLLITSLDGSNALYLNNGDGTFTLKENSGLGESNGSHSMAAADINGNGFPDLYIANYRLESVRDRYGPEDLSMENTTVTENGQMRIRSEFEDYYEIIEVDGEQLRREKGAEDQLFLNNGDGTFQQADLLQHFPVNIEGESGLFEDWGFTPAFRDLTGDGNPDLYVTNDFWSPDRLWINQGDGIFHALGQEAITNQSYSSMGVDMTDLNKDGLPDIMITEMLSGEHERRVRQFSDYMGRYQGSTHHNRNSLYLNRGDTTFAQIARFSGLEASEWSWATLFMDVDLDGHEDLLVATGFYRDYLDMDAQQEIARRYEEMGDEMLNRGEFLQFPVLNLSNKAFKNNGDLSFSDLSGDWGFEEEDISMGMAAGDLNNDGTPDLVVNRFNDEAVIYENLTSAPRIVVQLSGTPPNTAGIGASVELTGGPEPQKKEITSGGIYLSDFRKQLVFAATENSDDHSLTVTWRDGSKTVLNNLSANRIYDINQEKTAQLARDEPGQGHESISTPLFKDISESIGHTHEESDYDDFQRVQPLLPKSLSRTGPGIAWVDINDNGLDDLVITGGKGSSAGVFMNNGNGSFSKTDPGSLSRLATGDQVSVAAWKSDEGLMLAIGSANYEQGNPNAPSAYVYTISDGEVISSREIPGELSATGPVAFADISGDGHPELFVGGHFLPGGYPRDASSRIFSFRDGEWVLDNTNSQTLKDSGLVTSALFADFTGSGSQDLLLATEWGSLKLFENNDGSLRDITDTVGLSAYSGWWSGIAAGDFNNNGRMDIVALNTGLNSPYQTREQLAPRLYYDDITMNNQLDIVDSYYHREMDAYVPRRKLLDFRSIRTILQNVNSHQEYSESSIDQIFGQSFSNVSYKELNTTQHMLFLNQGDRFEATPLPNEAQFSNGYHAGVADFNNDGNEDLFVSQNSFEFPEAVTRLDAGRGLVLLGDGKGGFDPLSGSSSGVKIYSEQRGAASGDFDNDGRTDIAVTQNNSATRLLKNNTEKKGIRIQLVGTNQNTDAIGSGIRLIYPDGSKGPLRIIQSGSGYRSQNSSTQVLGFQEEPKAIEILWFDGTTGQTDYKPGDMEYVISYP